MEIHPHGYWTIADRRYRFDKRLAKNIAKFAKGRGVETILDVGCGGGAYTFFLRDMGFEVDGFDGNPHTPDITNGECMVADFATYLNILPRDMILCLEVAEHIPRSRQGVFVDNLLKSSPDIIIISWAVEGQGGMGHINCRNNDYVINLFSNYDYSYIEDASLELRRRSSMSWFKNTIMVYENKNA